MADQHDLARVGHGAAGPAADRTTGRALLGYEAGVFGLLAALGVAVAVQGWRLGLGDAERPGAGLWPLAIGVVWAVAAAGAAYETFGRGRRLMPLDRLGRPAIGLGLTVGFVLLFSYIGFVVSTLVTVVLWLRLLTSFGWLRVASVTTVITLIFYVLFAVVVGTHFPPSIVGLG